MPKSEKNNNQKDKVKSLEPIIDAAFKTNYDLLQSVENLPRKDWFGIPGLTLTQAQTLEALAKRLSFGKDIFDPLNRVFPAIETIAKSLRVDISTAKRRMKSLKEAGWIFKRERGGKKQTSNQYFFSKAIFIVAQATQENDQKKASKLIADAKKILDDNRNLNIQRGEINGSLSIAAKDVNSTLDELLSVDLAGDTAKVIDLVAILQQKHKALEHQRLQAKNATQGVVEMLPLESQNYHPQGLKTATLNTPIKSPNEISKLNKTTSEPRGEEKELNKVCEEFSEATGTKVTASSKVKLKKNMKDNGLDIEQVAKNVKKILTSPALKLTTNSIARAGYQTSLLVFGEREALNKFKRAAQAGQLSQELGHKFKSEHDAIKYLFPEILEARAQSLADEHGDTIEMAQGFFASLCDKDFVHLMNNYAGKEYRNWKAQSGFVPKEPEPQIPAMAQTGTESAQADFVQPTPKAQEFQTAQPELAPMAQPKIDFSDLPDLPF